MCQWVSGQIDDEGALRVEEHSGLERVGGQTVVTQVNGQFGVRYCSHVKGVASDERDVVSQRYVAQVIGRVIDDIVTDALNVTPNGQVLHIPLITQQWSECEVGQCFDCQSIDFKRGQVVHWAQGVEQVVLGWGVQLICVFDYQPFGVTSSRSERVTVYSLEVLGVGKKNLVEVDLSERQLIQLCEFGRVDDQLGEVPLLPVNSERQVLEHIANIEEVVSDAQYLILGANARFDQMLVLVVGALVAAHQWYSDDQYHKSKKT